MSETNSNEGIRVRFAPSPTGYLHIGGARTALFNYLYARRHGGTFVLRVEDTDRERSTPEAVQAIFEGMRYLGLDWDEGPEKGGDYGPYFQSERDSIYDELVESLLAKGKAYPCFCTRERLDELRASQMEAKTRVGYDRLCRDLDPEEVKRRQEAGEPYVIRFKVEEGTVRIPDLIRGEVKFKNEEIDDFIIRRADGTCVYNLAVVGDDSGMKITHVIRGEDHLTNTAKQVLLFEALDLPVPKYAHIPLIFGPKRQKLSKRHGAVSVTEYDEKGYLPEAMLNFLARMGWSFDDKEEIFSHDDLIEKFSLESISKSGAMYDVKKLEHLGSHWMRLRPTEEVLEMVLPRLVARSYLTEEQAQQDRERLFHRVELEKERRSTLEEICDNIAFYFCAIEELEPKALKSLKKQEGIAELLSKFASKIESVFGESDLQARIKAVENALTAFLEEEDVSLKQLAPGIRAVLTGRPNTPPLFDLIALMDQAPCLQRLSSADQWLSES